MVSRRVVAALLVLTASALQLAWLNDLHFPGGPPDLVLVVVISVALLEGPGVGMAFGFAAGLLGDLLGSHTVGRLALVWTLVGYGVGLIATDEDTGPLIPMAVIAGGTAVADVLYLGLGGLISDSHASGRALAEQIVASTVYDLVLAPFVFLLVRGLFRRLDPARV